MRRLWAGLIIVLWCGPGAVAADWHQSLYLGNGDYWRQRVRVEVHNGMAQPAAGAPVSLRVGAAPGEANLVGAAAESVRAVGADGVEVLYAIFGPDGQSVTRGPIARGSELVLPVAAPAGGDTFCYVYFDNPSAWPVPDFFSGSFGVRNGSVEGGQGASPYGWVHDGGDAQHIASWTTEAAHTGRHSLKLTVARGAAPSWVSTRQGGIYVTGGAHYVVRGWVKAESASDTAGWYLHVGNEASPMLVNLMLNGGKGSYDWKEVTAEFDAPAEANQAEVGTVLWGTGTAWFDDVTLECTTPPALTARASAPEAMKLRETGVGAAWFDDNPKDDRHWGYRWPVKLHNLSSSPRNGFAQLDVKRLLANRRLSRNSLRVVDGLAPLAFSLVGDTLLFPASLPARSAHTYYLYLSEDARIPAVAGTDYAGLLDSKLNLVQNASFERGSPRPEAWAASPPGGVTMGVDSPGRFGARAAKMTYPSTLPPSWTGWTQSVPVQAGRSYLFAAWLKTQEVANGTVQINAHYRNAAGELCQSKQYAAAGVGLSGTNDWTLMEGTFDMPVDCAAFQLHLTMNATGTVWHDGVVLAEVHPATLGEPEARASEARLTVWPVNAVVKVFREDFPPSAIPAARITAARNEQEPLQLAVRSTAAHRGVRVEVAPPTNAKGLKLSDVRVGVVGYVPVDNKSTYFSTNVQSWQRRLPNDPVGASDGWAGWWPDPLLPTDTFDLAANRTQPVWVTVRVPAEAAAGDYTGAVRLREGAKVLAEIPFSVRVWDFALPDTPHASAVYDIRLGDLWATPGKSMDQVREEVQQVMAEHRVCPDIIEPDPAITYANGTVTADFTAFDAAAEHYFNDLHLPRTYAPLSFYGFGWGHPPAPFMGENPYPGEWPYASADPGQLRPEYKAAYQACLRAYWEHMKAKGWEKRVVLYISDEPYYSNPRIIAQMKALCDMVHEVDPDIPIYSSTWQYVPEWKGYLDIWGLGHYGTVPPEQLAQIRAQGDRIVYTTDGQMCTDTPYAAVERLLPHYAFKYGAEGYEFWGVSWLTYNPYEFGWHAFISQSGEPGSYTWVRYPNGDGFLMYPGGLIGRDKPVSSVRLEQAREGQEDYEYLWLLRDRIGKAKAAGADPRAAEAVLAGAQELVSIPNAGGKNSTSLLPDPDAVFRVKEALAAAIEAVR